MINKLLYNKQSFEYLIPEYLYPYLFRFSLRYDIDIWDKQSLEVNFEQLFELKKILKDTLLELFDEFYHEPTQAKRSKHPGRYIKILLGNRIYIIDYRSDPMGMTAYSIYSLLQWVEQMLENTDKVNL